MTNAVVETVDRQGAERETAHAANDAGDSAIHYIETVGALYERAVSRGELPLLGWALTRWLAWIVYRHRGPMVFPDVVGWLGSHLEEFAKAERAQAELAAMRERGAAVN